MTTITLYKYTRSDGSVAITPNMPSSEYTVMYRLIADSGKLLTQDDTSFVPCADVYSAEGWYEVDTPISVTDPEEYTLELEKADMEAALALLGITDEMDEQTTV